MFNLGQFLGHVMGGVATGAQNIAQNLSHPAQFFNSMYHPQPPQDNWSRLTPQQQAAFKPYTLPDSPAMARAHAQNVAMLNSGPAAPPRPMHMLAQHATSIQPPLAVADPGQWQHGPLMVQPTYHAGGQYVNPFDTDAQGLDPMSFSGVHNPQVYNRMYRNF